METALNSVRVVIGIEDGKITGASSDGPVDIVVLDYRTDGQAEESICEIPIPDGSSVVASVSAFTADESLGDWVDQVFNTLESGS